MSEELTVERAGALCAGLVPAYGPVRAVSRFAEGSVTGAYRIEFAHADAAPVVLKIYGTDDLWLAAKEARALRFLTDHGIDVSPRVLAFSRSAEALAGRPCVISALRPGRTLAAVDDELSCAQRHEVYRQLGQVLGRLHAVPAHGYGYVSGEIRDPLPDNSAHMARMFERYLGEFREHTADPALADRIAAHVAAHASAFAACPRPAYCHGDVHEPNLLVEIAEDGTCTLTGLLDPQNLHAGDPLMDFVRLDAFSLHGDPTKRAGLLSGYGVRTPGRRPGEWPEAWRSRLPLYRLALALELHNWFTTTGRTHHLPALDRELRTLVGEAVPED
ncbi:aminoglycoside phosphotransferase family protein [Streptomyces sp. NPDC006393]|uniref:phosphotransferase family protein n=1 Tax=Streptomyces sp. NPDC006393 TaxID=3156763 RepID=UPI0034119028